jgi:hypothetical protein
MKTLLSQANIDFTKIRTFITKTTASELMALSEPCYYPSHKKYYHQLRHYTNIPEREVKNFPKTFWKGMPEATYQIQKDPIRLFYSFLLYVVANKPKEKRLFPIIMTLISIREYSNLMHRQIKYCNSDYFNYALQNQTKTHLFSREKTIGNSLYFLSLEMVKKHFKGIKAGDKEVISKFMQELRTRISQSIKSFAELYYAAAERGEGIKTEIEPEEGTEYQIQSQDKITRLVDGIVKKITVYKEVDNKAITEARKATKINQSIATGIASTITNLKYSDNVRVCLTLFIKDITNKNQICGSGYNTYLKKHMSIKRTKQRVYFKQQILILLQKVLKEMKVEDKYNMFTNQTKFSINSFLARYLISFLRNQLC